MLKIIEKKAFKKRFENSGILAVGCREICVSQRVYPVFIFPCKSGGFFFSSFYVSDLSYTVPTIVFLHFRAIFNLYIKVVQMCFFTWDPLSCLRRQLRRISRWPLENCLPLKIHPVKTDTKQIISSLISNSHSLIS